MRILILKLLTPSVSNDRPKAKKCKCIATGKLIPCFVNPNFLIRPCKLIM